MDNQRHRPTEAMPAMHPAYQRLDLAAGRPAGNDAAGPFPRPRPGGYPGSRPAAASFAEPVCPRCHTWASCCYCTAEVAGMRDALRRIAELHSACQPALCPERARLAAIPRRPAERPHP